MTTRERAVIVSGFNQYVPLLDYEKGAHVLRFYFTSLTSQIAFYENREWYPSKRFYGRFAFASGRYVYKERFVNFQDQLVLEERADALMLNANAQCAYVDIQSLAIEGIAAQPAGAAAGVAFEKGGPAGALAAAIGNLIDAFSDLLTGGPAGARVRMREMLKGNPGRTPSSLRGSDYRAINTRRATGHPIDGFFYSMSAGASGQMVIRAMIPDEVCFLVGGTTPASSNEDSPPPATAGGNESSGGGGAAPPPTGTAPPPPTGVLPPATGDIPQPINSPDRPGNGPPSTGVACRVYLVTTTFVTNGNRSFPNPTRRAGRVGGIEIRSNPAPPGGIDRSAWYKFGIGCPGAEGEQMIVDWSSTDPFPNRIPSGLQISIVEVPNNP